MNKSSKLIIAVAILAIFGFGCSKKPTNTVVPAVGASRTNIANNAFTVKIQPNGEFDPVTAFVKKDTVLTFENDSQKPHGVIPREDADKKFAGLDSKGEITPGKKFSVTMDEVGRWLYSDRTNPAFGGAVEVSE